MNCDKTTYFLLFRSSPEGVQMNQQVQPTVQPTNQLTPTYPRRPLETVSNDEIEQMLTSLARDTRYNPNKWSKPETGHTGLLSHQEIKDLMGMEFFHRSLGVKEGGVLVRDEMIMIKFFLKVYNSPIHSYKNPNHFLFQVKAMLPS